MNEPALKVYAVVVTYNRRELLLRCLAALASQTRKPEMILIIDNASTDGSCEALSESGLLQRTDVQLVSLHENTGGAGGFSAGLRQAIDGGADWVWMMDDDAEPHSDALRELMQVAVDPANVYGSLATSGDETSWLMTLLTPHPKTASTAIEVPASAQVRMLPFLGFLIHRELVGKIGLPDAGFFIAADDVEYCVRARKAGARIIVAGKSHIEHPKSRPYEVRFPGFSLTALELPPWKRYYDTRNRLLIARKHYGVRLFSQTIPGSFVRMGAALVKEPRKLAQLKAFTAGFVDGLLGRKGRRHENWGIK
jgi:glycosyltransferase involved in cell wall biosynthesis